MSEKETTTILRTPSSNTLTIKRPKINIPEGKLFVQRDDEEKKEWQTEVDKMSSDLRGEIIPADIYDQVIKLTKNK